MSGNTVDKGKAAGEVEFQRNQYIQFAGDWIDAFLSDPNKHTLEEMLSTIKELAVGHFNFAKHGIEEHL